ncbi:MAG: hypothetical protein OQJ81_12850 [Melioribacteraceae bacterium]|nr:hypothetical protein [Melioribacteraceae bacterium]
MKNLISKITLITITSISLLLLSGMYTLNLIEYNSIKSNSVRGSNLNIGKGYTDLVIYNENYYLIGPEERIDIIYKNEGKNTLHRSGENKLNCITANGDLIITVGDNGTILYSINGEDFYYSDAGSNKNIYEVVYKAGIYFAASDEGEILVSENGLKWFKKQTGAEGNIISLSSNNNMIIGVTNMGEIIKSTDGIDWEIKQYNREYAGFYQYSIFRKVVATDNTIVIIGIHDDGTPSILFSTLGNVWSKRIPIYIDENGISRYLVSKPNDIAYDFNNNQFIVVCDNGELLSLPSCSKCNKYFKIEDTNLNAVIIHERNMIIAGSSFTLFKQSISIF